jgi:CDP-diacylglycerol--glycerol-3-phosphate 3-phosphatidyltransferase
MKPWLKDSILTMAGAVMIESIPDTTYAVILCAVAGVSAAAYAVRTAMHGQVTYRRVEALGGSALISKPVLSWAYWTLQPVKRACLAIGLSANAVTWISLILGVLSAAAIALGHLGLGAFVGIIGALGDAIDGMIARERGEASNGGALLDAVVDRYVESLFLGALVIHYFAHRGVVVLLLLAWLGSYMISYASAKADAFQIAAPRGIMRRHERSAYLLGGALLSSWTIPHFEHALPASAPRGIPLLLAVGVVAVLANVSAIQRMVAIASASRAAAPKSEPKPVRKSEPAIRSA